MKYKEFKTREVRASIDNLFEAFLTEGVHDKGIFKAVFLSGGPGSGKDYVLDNTLQGQGLTEINSDKALEFLSDKKVTEEVKAKNVSELRQRLAISGRNGLIVNGTGDDIEKITTIKGRLEDIGYDTSMLFVVTDDEVSRQRNIERGQRGGRAVPEDVRKKKWDIATATRSQLAELFGDNYMEFDNSTDLRNSTPDIVKQKKDELAEISNTIGEFVSRPPENEIAKEWIANQLLKRNKVSKNGSDLTAPVGSEAHDAAGELGLDYYGSGKYGKKGTVTHHSVNGKLVEPKNDKDKEKKKVKESIDTDFSTFLSEAVTVSVTGDTAEEVINTIRVLTSNSDTESDDTKFSDNTARTLLQLKSHSKIPTADIPEPMWGSSNTQEKVNENVQLVQESIEVGSEDGRSSGTEAGRSIRGHGNFAKTKTITQIKNSIKQKINEIDQGTEVGMSMSGGGENAARGSLSNRAKKRPFDEMQGDETTASIGDKKEDELLKQGISLSLFKKRNYQ